METFVYVLILSLNQTPIFTIREIKHEEQTGE